MGSILDVFGFMRRFSPLKGKSHLIAKYGFVYCSYKNEVPGLVDRMVAVHAES